MIWLMKNILSFQLFELRKFLIEKISSAPKMMRIYYTRENCFLTILLPQQQSTAPPPKKKQHGYIHWLNESFIEWPEIIEDSLCSSVHSSETKMGNIEENSESIKKWRKKYTKLKYGTQKHFILKWVKRKYYKGLADRMRCLV